MGGRDQPGHDERNMMVSRLAHWFGTSAEMRLNMQKLYELRLAEQEKGAEIRKLPKHNAA